ncbi:hypothetical protein [Streptomyces sp. NPDC097619]|uniref:hypothetical protein n=1 Tax=Streptomyces sp. NPDC097619 TaxID=3157228 RepID=UPI0033295745
MTTIPARLDPRLVTVEGTAYGPYVGMPLCPLAAPGEHLWFTRATAEQIVRDLNVRDAGCGLSGAFSGDGALTFTWTAEYGGRRGAGSESFSPDAHGRYPVGGLWMWDLWDETAVPHTAGQAAFARGAAEFRRADGSASYPEPLDGLYRQGRAEALSVSLNAPAPDAAAPGVDVPLPGAEIHPGGPGGVWRVTWGRLSGVGPDLEAAKRRLMEQVEASVRASQEEPVFARTGDGRTAVAIARGNGADYYQSTERAFWLTARFVDYTPDEVVKVDAGAVPIPPRQGEPPITDEDIEGLVTAFGITEDDLDEAVHELFAERASDLNNEGPHAQVKHLAAQCRDYTELRSLLDDLISR